jgi:hypothetical protein
MVNLSASLAQVDVARPLFSGVYLDFIQQHQEQCTLMVSF